MNSDTLSTIPLGNAFFWMKKENLLRDVGMEGFAEDIIRPKHLLLGRRPVEGRYHATVTRYWYSRYGKKKKIR